MSRFFDRLSINFTISIILQITFIVAVILPHVKVSNNAFMGVVGIAILLVTVIIYAFYLMRVLKIFRIFIKSVICGFAVAAIFVLGSSMSEIMQSVTLALTVFALTLPLSKSYGEAFIMCVTQLCVAFIFCMSQIPSASIFINAIVFALYLVMLFINIFRRRMNVCLE